MNQHKVEPIADALYDLLEALWITWRDDDVPQRTQHERPRVPRPGGFDQPVQLEAKCPAAERERLDQQSVGLLFRKGAQEGGP